MRLRSFIIVNILIGLFFVFSPTPAIAACLPIFNGGASCSTSSNIHLLKEVKHPQTGQYTSSLSSQGPFFTPSQTVNFRLTVENTSKNAIKAITITDTFPQYVRYQTGNGKFDSTKNTLTITIDELKANEKRNFEITGKIASKNDLAKLAGNMNCFINQVALTTRGNNVQTNTQYCVDKTLPEIITQPSPTPTTGFPITKISPTPQSMGRIIHPTQPAKQTPATGAGALSLLLFIPTALVGWYLRQKIV